MNSLSKEIIVYFTRRILQWQETDSIDNYTVSDKKGPLNTSFMVVVSHHLDSLTELEPETVITVKLDH